MRCVSFGLERGECLGIVGESGSGKSVSTIAIPGLLPRNTQVSGSIRYEGRELAGLGTKALREYRGRKIGMIFQEPGRSFDPLQNMGSAFLETFRNSEPGIPKEEAFRRAAELLAETGLERGHGYKWLDTDAENERLRAEIAEPRAGSTGLKCPPE